MSNVFKCPKCRCEHDKAQYETAVSIGMGEAICFKAICDRIDGSINEWKLLGSEACRRGDIAGLWEANQMVKHLEGRRDGLRKPNIKDAQTQVKQEGNV